MNISILKVVFFCVVEKELKNFGIMPIIGDLPMCRNGGRKPFQHATYVKAVSNIRSPQKPRPSPKENATLF